MAARVGLVAVIAESKAAPFCLLFCREALASGSWRWRCWRCHGLRLCHWLYDVIHTFSSGMVRCWRKYDSHRLMKISGSDLPSKRGKSIFWNRGGRSVWCWPSCWALEAVEEATFSCMPAMSVCIFATAPVRDWSIFITYVMAGWSPSPMVVGAEVAVDEEACDGDGGWAGVEDVVEEDRRDADTRLSRADLPGANLAEEEEQPLLFHLDQEDLEPMVPEAGAEENSEAASGISSDSSMEVVLAVPPSPQPPPPAPMFDAGHVNLILPIHLPAAQDPPQAHDPPQAPPLPLRPPIKLVYSRRPKAAGPSASAPVVLPPQSTPVATGVHRKDKVKTPLSDKDLRRSLRLKIKSLGFKRNIHPNKAGPSIQDFPAIEDFINISSDSDGPESTPADRGVPSPAQTS
ncbi:hypothetical protein GUJ93_ZPchr0002g23339 [Zizania palustris]|uniref:Uncharacterized protein n=1 Tax=Zizania palustris TaxID=103762 RepID=A0A8J5SAB8_ZIZPA|nr:hypothetical protein GUJ93_ZPchr0002g23339 [Zizania palustris]